MKKITAIIFSLSLITLLAVGCNNQSPSNQLSGNNNLTTEREQTDEIINNDQKIKTDEAEAKPEDKQNLDSQANVITEYFVNTNNYLIKPLKSEDESKVVLLTFDDTPQGDHTREILDILDKYQAKAIFFINGHYAERHKDLTEEIYSRGHILGNHTWWHEYLPKLTAKKTEEEIIKVSNLIEEITGKRPIYFRPPNGKMTDAAQNIITKEGMQKMNWSLGSLDWEYTKPEDARKVVDQVVNNLHPGANILMHDKHVTALALEEILSEITKQGYKFVLPTEVIIKQ